MISEPLGWIGDQCVKGDLLNPQRLRCVVELSQHVQVAQCSVGMTVLHGLQWMLNPYRPAIGEGAEEHAVVFLKNQVPNASDCALGLA